MKFLIFFVFWLKNNWYYWLTAKKREMGCRLLPLKVHKSIFLVNKLVASKSLLLLNSECTPKSILMQSRQIYSIWKACSIVEFAPKSRMQWLAREPTKFYLVSF